jgi:hypothetical protein
METARMGKGRGMRFKGCGVHHSRLHIWLSGIRTLNNNNVYIFDPF